MDVRFSRFEISRRCEQVFSLYNAAQGRALDMCRAKIKHSRIVAKNSDRIARGLRFSRYDRDIAWIIGKLHDFGRFGQIVVTETFKDSERWNHATWGPASCSGMA